jgi:hypothetical protein
MKYFYEEHFDFRLPYRLIGVLPIKEEAYDNSNNVKWCKENLKDTTKWYYTLYLVNTRGARTVIWEFKNKEDAILFKLAQGGDI